MNVRTTNSAARASVGAGPEHSMKHTIFFSWQDDTPTECGRNFIHQAIEKAIKLLNSDAEIEESVRDRNFVARPGNLWAGILHVDGRLESSRVFERWSRRNVVRPQL
jgi:hypothetical protein